MMEEHIKVLGEKVSKVVGRKVQRKSRCRQYKGQKAKESGVRQTKHMISKSKQKLGGKSDPHSLNRLVRHLTTRQYKLSMLCSLCREKELREPESSICQADRWGTMCRTRHCDRWHIYMYSYISQRVCTSCKLRLLLLYGRAELSLGQELVIAVLHSSASIAAS